MMNSAQNQWFYEFGKFRLNVEKKLLWRDGQPVALTLKEFEVLLVLVENAGQMITKEDLLDAVWNDVFIEEGTLTRNISRLRKKLTDANGKGEKFIETLPKRGYRFLLEVTKANAAALIIEEQTSTHISVNETITLAPDENSEQPSITERLQTTEKRHANSKTALFALGFVAVAAVAFLIYQNYFQNRAAGIVASRVVSFTGATGRENSPSFSTDGKQIAYSWNGGESKQWDIYVRLVGEGEPMQLTETKVNEQYPTFSPDGSHIAFVREFGDHGEVLVVPSLGGAERKIARLFSGNYSISYAPDGQTIAVIDTENSSQNGQYAVYLINIETGARERLTAPAKFTGETTPRFSPDGKSLAFVRISADQKQDLFVVPATGGEPRQITFDEAVIHSLAWSADGQMIYFVSMRGSNQANVWRVPATGGAPQIVSTGSSGITNIAVSPDGRTLAFVENTLNANIWRVTTDGKPAERLFASTSNEYDPQFAPDDSRILFLSDRSGKYEIWTADADGKNSRQITKTPFEIGSPRLSPDESRIAFYQKQGETSNIFTCSSEGEAIRQLTFETSRNISPAWSADGKWIYFTSNRTGEMNIWKIPAEGGESIQVTKNGAYQAAPAFDGKFVFYSKTNTFDVLWSVPTEGGAEESVAELTDAGDKWSISPSGVYFLVRQPDQSFKIKFYDFAARQIKDISGDYKIPSGIEGSLGVNAEANVFLCSLKDQDDSRILLAEIK